MAGISTVLSITDRMTNPITAINNALGKLLGTVDATDAATKNVGKDGAEQMKKFTNEIKKTEKASNSLEKMLKKVVGAVSVMGTINFAANWVSDAFEASNTQMKAAAMLKNSLANSGGTEEDFNNILNKASELQGKSIYGADAFTAGAAELSTYLSDGDAVIAMMDTLSNYATGMSNAEALDPSGMVDMATQLGKALNGSYDGLTKKGFELTDQQKEIIANGSDMEKALVISDVINESWDGLAENMANLPSGQAQKMVNSFDDVKAVVGDSLQPVLGKLFTTINAQMPKIEKVLVGISSLIGGIIHIISSIIDVLAVVYDFFVEHADAVRNVIKVISGVISATVAFAYNLLMGLVNSIIDMGLTVWNYFASFFNFFANMINDFPGSVVRLFADLADTVLGFLETIATAIDWVFGSHLSDTVKDWRDTLNTKVVEMVGEAAVDLRVKDFDQYHLLDGTRLGLEDAYNAGADWGEEFANSFGTSDQVDYLAGIALNTEKIQDDVEETNGVNTEMVAWLRDIAERDAINRFTTAEVTVQLGGITNNVTGDNANVDGIVNRIADALSEQLSVTAAAYNADF